MVGQFSPLERKSIEPMALQRTSRTHSHKPLNLWDIFFMEHIDLKNN
jgi:hypothetical protein